MNIIIAIKFLLGLMIVLYVLGLIVVWLYDVKKNNLYRVMQERDRGLMSLNLSMAVLYAKKYKILEDYRRDTFLVEREQHFILENLLLIRRRTLKN